MGEGGGAGLVLGGHEPISMRPALKEQSETQISLVCLILPLGGVRTVFLILLPVTRSGQGDAKLGDMWASVMTWATSLEPLVCGLKSC